MVLEGRITAVLSDSISSAGEVRISPSRVKTQALTIMPINSSVARESMASIDVIMEEKYLM